MHIQKIQVIPYSYGLSVPYGLTKRDIHFTSAQTEHKCLHTNSFALAVYVS